MSVLRILSRLVNRYSDITYAFLAVVPLVRLGALSNSLVVRYKLTNSTIKLVKK